MSETIPPAAATPRTVLITGAAKRIGRALALDFAKHGWAVAVHYNGSRSQAEDLARQIEAGGGRAVAIKGDLGNDADVDNLVPACVEKLGRLDCLINNASVFLEDDAGALTAERWDKHLDINLKAPVFLAQAFADQLPAERTGNIINIIDQRVLHLTPDFFSYTISKSGLWTATRTLAQALAPRIRVNAIAPGPTLKSIHQSDAQFEAERSSTPLRRGCTPAEIAACARFILDAPAMTGQMIALDGGQHLASGGSEANLK